MGLNLGGGGDYAPFVKYNSKAGRMYKKEGDQEIEIQPPISFIADFKNIKTGWFMYAEGLAPSIVYDADLSTPAAKPSDKHKRGFKLELFNQQNFGGVVEFSSASMHVCQAINDLYTKYEGDKGANPGQYPVISYTGSTPQKDKHGTNYRPSFAITKWVSSDAFNKSNVVPITPASQSATIQEQPKAAAVSEF